MPWYLLATPIANLAVLSSGVMAAAQPATTAQDPLAALAGPIAGTGIVGVVLLMVIQRWKIMPTYVFDDAKAAWAEERARLMADLADAREGLKEANAVYTSQVIPTLTRVLDAERELVDLKRDEATRRRHRDE